MTDRDPAKLLKTLSQSAADRTETCPGDHELAGFVDDQLSRDHTESIRNHLADCEYCVRQVGLLVRVQEGETESATSEFVLARARRLAAEKNPTRLFKLRHWAAAAVLVLAVLSIVTWSERSPDTGMNETGGIGIPNPALHGPGQVRNFGSDVYVPEVLTPSENSVIAPGDLRVHWTESADAIYYEIRVVSDEGSLVWQQRVESGDEALPGKIGLEPGKDYFVRVDAYLPEARKLSSHHVLFTVGE